MIQKPGVVLDFGSGIGFDFYVFCSCGIGICFGFDGVPSGAQFEVVTSNEHPAMVLPGFLVWRLLIDLEGPFSEVDAASGALLFVLRDGDGDHLPWRGADF